MAEKKKDNMELYNKFRAVPEGAKKTIKGGRLNGMTDINPMWRIKKLTEVFGPVGFGWYTEVVKTWTEVDENADVAVFVDIKVLLCGSARHDPSGTVRCGIIPIRIAFADSNKTSITHIHRNYNPFTIMR